MARRKKPVEHSIKINDGISHAFGAIEELKDELQNWRDNLPESKQQSGKADELDEAIQGLEQDSEPEIPNAVEEWDVQYTYAPARKASRADRRDEAVAILNAIAEKCQGVVEDPQGAYDEDELNEIRTFAEACSDAVTSWENVEFPGMFG